MREDGFSGGCQCGAVRYHSTMAAEGVHFCHCRMCQRAVGNVFAALAVVRKETVTWTGQPSFYASSSVAERGFCARCGTPLTFAYPDSDWMSFTIGSLDDPEAAVPEVHCGVESRLSWLHVQDGLPVEYTDSKGERLRDMVSKQGVF
ncbi:GFA family protein [Azospirillum sp. B4]|uniref:GFA family protein n=1 Tax=Azospirillum sp. B4 TaxID=95605 RepID=UPI0003489F5E|nr:GFA family protein [Azospirillum sp. B4]